MQAEATARGVWPFGGRLKHVVQEALPSGYLALTIAMPDLVVVVIANDVPAAGVAIVARHASDDHATMNEFRFCRLPECPAVTAWRPPAVSTDGTAAASSA